jgi:molybdopterin-containing oxidoreductase family membrane subunit
MAEKKTLNWSFYGWIAVIATGILIGLYGAAMLLIKGHVVMGTTDQLPWGILVPAYVFFVVTSTGLCMVSSLGHVFGIKRWEIIGKRAVFLAIITLLAGGIIIILDLGSPLRAIYFLLSPNPTSAMWWMSALYTFYLIFMLVEFYLLSKQDFKKVQIVAALALLSAISAHSTLGALFGFAFARPYFGGAFAPLYFILSALVSGIAILALVTIVEHRVTKKEMNPELHSLMTVDLSKLLALVLGIALFFAIWKDVAGLYNPAETTALAYRYMLFGPAGWWYWGIVILMGLIIPFILMLNRGTRNVNGTLTASILVLVGMFAGRFEFVIGGQVVALIQGLQHLQWPFASYSPTFVEIAVVIFAFALCALLYTLGSRKLALEEVPYYA